MKFIKLFENFKEIQNIIIVGGGISSLYAAYLIKKRFPKIKYTILEKNKHCGGRVFMDTVSDVEVPTGAHFSRLSKDKLLKELLKELDIKVSPYNLEINFTFKPQDVESMVDKLKRNHHKYDRSKFTFSQFAKEVLGEKDYDKFIDMMGYTDFENADFEDTLFNYGLDDNIPGYKVADIPWNSVVEKLISEIGKNNIKLNTEVNSIKKVKDKYIINNDIECDGVILAVTINQLKKLIDDPIYNQIGSQSFLKAFAKTSGLEDIKKYTVVDSPLKKIIPIKKDVFTIAFSDNKDANFLNSKDKSYFEKELSNQFDSEVKIKDIKKFFWEEGTHYFKPLQNKFESRKEFLKKAQHPKENMWVIGEVVAERQGWVEGALNSVENISLFNKHNN